MFKCGVDKNLETFYVWQCAKYHPVLVCALKTCAHRAMTIFFHHTFELEIALPIIRAFHSNFHNSKQDIKNLHDQLSCQWWKVITIAEIYQLSVCKLWLRETKSLWVFCFVNHMPQKTWNKKWWLSFTFTLTPRQVFIKERNQHTEYPIINKY